MRACSSRCTAQASTGSATGSIRRSGSRARRRWRRRSMRSSPSRRRSSAATRGSTAASTSCSSSSTACRCTSACATSRRARRLSSRATASSRSRRGTFAATRSRSASRRRSSPSFAVCCRSGRGIATGSGRTSSRSHREAHHDRHRDLGGVMEGTAEVNGVNLWYRSAGKGEPVVQIHGAGFGHFNFDPATPELSKHFRVDRLRHAGLRRVGPPGSGLRHGGVGGRPRRPHGRARDRPGARPRHVDGRDDRHRLRRQVPGAHDLRRHQLRCGEARRDRPPDLQELDRHRPPGPGRARQPRPGRADHVAGAVQALPRGAERRGAHRPHPADPARLESDRGVHGRLSGHVRHGPDRSGCRRSRRRRSCSAETRT